MAVRKPDDVDVPARDAATTSVTRFLRKSDKVDRYFAIKLPRRIIILNDRTALVLGATGGVGGDVAVSLLQRNWHVRALARDPVKAATRWHRGIPGPSWIGGDAMDTPSVIKAAGRDVSLIVHAVNPPGYRNWAKLVVPMLESSIATAKVSGARILLPGTVYNYGPDAFPLLTESSPQHPQTRKGAIRVQMENRLRQASNDGVCTLIVRAGDYFGPHPGNSWFSQAMVTPGRPMSSISYPGRPGIGHQWAYLPDVAETMVRLVEREDVLGTFESFHMDGHWDADGTQMTGAIRTVVGNPSLPVRAFPWWLVIVASPFVPLFREMSEMRYLWRSPIRLDNSKLVACLGAEPHTPFDRAVRTSLEGLGCLSDDRERGPLLG
jgi:nucleoside-diphosphate-sugar epimerase